MNIYLTKRNIDEIPTSSIFLTFCSDEKPLKGETGLLDWRMNGFISKQLEENKINGALGENILIPASSKINAKRIYLFGMGDSSSITETKINDIALNIKKILKGMGENKFTFALSRKLTDSKEYSKYLKLFFKNFISELESLVESIYFHYVDPEEKTTLAELKNEKVKLFEEKV